MRAKSKSGERFFLIMGLILIAIVFGGFALPVLVRSGDVSAMPILLHLHGAVFFAWFLLFWVQAKLIGTGDVRLHMSLGKASVLVSTAMIVLGYLVLRGALAKPGFSIAGMPAAPSAMFPFTDMLNFIIVYGLALANRRVPAAHKRLMLLAGILIIDPAAARLVMSIGGLPPVILLLELALFAALITYDVMTRRRPHWASMLGLGLFVLALVAKLTVAQTPVWASFVDAFLS
jgi:hypothetical protein